MSYADNAYYSGQQADAYYYDHNQQQQQRAAEEENTIDLRPADITDHQDKIIQLVAKYVAYSCNDARFQHLLIQRTKFNSYFDFVSSPDHKYYEYYQHLVRSYRYYCSVVAANSAGQGSIDEGYAFYTEQLRQQEQQLQQQQYQAGMYYAAQMDSGMQYMDPSAPSATTATFGGYYDANSVYSPHEQRYQQQVQQQGEPSVLGPSLTAAEAPREVDVGNKRARSATPQESSDEDEELELNFVMENGVARVISK